MDLLLIRHANNPDPSPAEIDPDLTETGIIQAHRLGARLKMQSIDLLYASTLRRAQQTAQIVSDATGVPLQPCEALREIHFGRLRHETWEDVEKDLPGYHAEWSRHLADLPYPGGECGADVAARALPVVEAVIASGAARVALVTHGGVIRSLLCVFLGLSQEKRFQFGAPLENTSITTVRWDAKKARYFVHALNDTSHLA